VSLDRLGLLERSGASPKFRSELNLELATYRFIDVVEITWPASQIFCLLVTHATFVLEITQSKGNGNEK
jgi:hypothetical protein